MCAVRAARPPTTFGVSLNIQKKKKKKKKKTHSKKALTRSRIEEKKVLDAGVDL